MDHPVSRARSRLGSRQPFLRVNRLCSLPPILRGSRHHDQAGSLPRSHAVPRVSNRLHIRARSPHSSRRDSQLMNHRVHRALSRRGSSQLCRAHILRSGHLQCPAHSRLVDRLVIRAVCPLFSRHHCPALSLYCGPLHGQRCSQVHSRLYSRHVDQLVCLALSRSHSQPHSLHDDPRRIQVCSRPRNRHCNRPASRLRSPQGSLAACRPASHQLLRQHSLAISRVFSLAASLRARLLHSPQQLLRRLLCPQSR